MTEDLQGPDDAVLIDALVRLVIEIAPALFHVLQEVIASNRSIEARLVAIDKKLDQLIVREINGALQIVKGIATISSASMKERHLLEAESNLLKNIGLEAEQSTAGLPNAHWIGRAYFGLANVALLRGEHKDASRLLLNVFAVSPRDARENLAKEIYTRLIAPACADVRDAYERENARLPAYESRVRELRKKIRWRRLGQAGTGAGGVVLWLLAGPGRGTDTMARTGHALSVIESEISQLQAEIDAVPTADSMRSKMELALDDRCREFARKMLDQPGESAVG